VLRIRDHRQPLRPRVGPAQPFDGSGGSDAAPAGDTLAISWTSTGGAVLPQVWWWLWGAPSLSDPGAPGSGGGGDDGSDGGLRVVNATVARPFTRADLCPDGVVHTADGAALPAFSHAAGAGWVDPGVTYTAVLTGLAAAAAAAAADGGGDTIIAYRYGDAGVDGGMSP
jgi:hypothetical protein